MYYRSGGSLFNLLADLFCLKVEAVSVLLLDLQGARPVDGRQPWSNEVCKSVDVEAGENDLHVPRTAWVQVAVGCVATHLPIRVLALSGAS